MKPQPKPIMLSIRQVAARWSCSIDSVRCKIAAGELAALRLGPKLIRVPIAEVVRVEQDALTRPADLEASS